MELTKLLFNNLSLSKNSLKPSSDISMKSEEKFESCLNSASQNKKVSKSDNVSNKKSLNNKKTDKSVKNTDSKQADSIEQNSTDNQNYDSSKEVDSKISEMAESSQTDEKQNVISEKESEAIEEVAEVLGIQPDEVKNVLESLGVNIFDLKDNDVLISFLQEVFNVDSPTDLLSIDGIKNIMLDVKQAAEEKISDFADLFQDFNLEDLKELKRESVAPQDDSVIISSTEDSVLNSQIEDTVTTEKTVNHTVIKNQKDSSENKTQENFADNAEEDFHTDAVSIKTVESTATQNNASNQQGFLNNSNTPFEAKVFTNNNGISAAAFDNIDKAFSQIVSKTQSMRNVNTADVVNQIIEKFKAGIVKQDVSEIKITLKPEYLGDVSLKLVSENGIVSAQFTAENQRVKEIIESNFNQLKNMLDEQGVQVSALSVSIGNDENSNQNKSFDDFQKSSKSSKRINSIIDASEPENEIVTDNISQYSVEDDIIQTSVNYTA